MQVAQDNNSERKLFHERLCCQLQRGGTKSKRRNRVAARQRAARTEKCSLPCKSKKNTIAKI